jgi:membrane protease YdiL (CAAX protease family)
MRSQAEQRGMRDVHTLEEYVRGLSPRAEFLIVVLGAFALPALFSLVAVLNLGSAPGPVELRNEDLEALIVQEAAVLMLLGWLLHARGWSVDNFGPYPSWRELVAAAGLWLAILVLSKLQDSIVDLSGTPMQVRNGGFDWPVVLAISIINPLFEELLLCAYVIPFVAQRQGTATGIAVALAIRLACHTYLGGAGLAWIAMVGLVLSLYYVRTRRLWPVLIAHGVLDFVGLATA